MAALGSNLEQGLKAVFIYWTKKGCNDRDTDHYDNEVHFKREPKNMKMQNVSTKSMMIFGRLHPHPKERECG